MNKKAQEVGRNTILIIILFLVAIVVVAVIYWQAGDTVVAYSDRLFSRLFG